MGELGRSPTGRSILGNCSAANSRRGDEPSLSQRTRNLNCSALSEISVLNEDLYVAVGTETNSCKRVLNWTLKNNPNLKKVVLLHVHRPQSLIPVMGGLFRPNQLAEQQVKLFRQQEAAKMDAVLKEYIIICRSSKVEADKLVLEMDDIAGGIIKAIEQNGIRKLVMGVSAYSRSSKKPKSKVAKEVWNEASSSCNIWFIYRGDLLKTREAARANSIATSSSRSTCESESEVELEFETDGRPGLPSIIEDSLTLDESLYLQLKQAHEEAAKFRDAAHEESVKLSDARKELLNAKIREKQLERNYDRILKLRQQMEDAAAKEQIEVEKLTIQRDELIHELQLRKLQQSALEERIAKMECLNKEFVENLLEARRVISSLQKERDELLQVRNNAVRELEMLQNAGEEVIGDYLMPYVEFTYAEIQEVTQNFNSSFKIGEGSYGCVYKALLRHTEVAIKVLNTNSMQGQSEFLQELSILSRVRHPHLISLIGACHEIYALVYEFLPNGSLEDCLDHRRNTPTLSWQDRTRIIAEICSALIFLHSNNPEAIVHGDLKPANILLDANLVCKLGDFGISRLLQTNSATTIFHLTEPKGTPVYMDPEFLSTGMLTPRSDVYAFGMIVLRLLTRRSAVGLVRDVKDAIKKGNLQRLLDPTAGNWPYEQAKSLAHLALRCCEVDRRNRPDLVNDVWKVLEPIKRAALPSESTTLQPSLSSSANIPSCFLCPIFKEIMQDPQFAADGYTYEAKAITGLFRNGCDISPVTSQKLPHKNLIPNLSLRSSIQEWLQQSRH